MLVYPLDIELKRAGARLLPSPGSSTASTLLTCAVFPLVVELVFVRTLAPLESQLFRLVL
jgi:hypothetical protein